MENNSKKQFYIPKDTEYCSCYGHIHKIENCPILIKLNKVLNENNVPDGFVKCQIYPKYKEKNSWDESKNIDKNPNKNNDIDKDNKNNKEIEESIIGEDTFLGGSFKNCTNNIPLNDTQNNDVISLSSSYSNSSNNVISKDNNNNMPLEETQNNEMMLLSSSLSNINMPLENSQNLEMMSLSSTIKNIINIISRENGNIWPIEGNRYNEMASLSSSSNNTILQNNNSEMEGAQINEVITLSSSDSNINNNQENNNNVPWELLKNYNKVELKVDHKNIIDFINKLRRQINLLPLDSSSTVYEVISLSSSVSSINPNNEFQNLQ